MSTTADPRWIVTTAVQRVAPDDRGRAEITVTVTNQHDSARPASVVLVSEDEAAQPWFSVAEAERAIEAGASVPFAVTVSVPPGARSGEYAFYALVRSGDAGADEVRSNRVLLAVPPPAPARRRRPVARLVGLAVGVVVLAVLVTVGAVHLARRNPPPLAEPSPAVTTGARVSVPNVIGATDVEAIAATLIEAGLVPIIRYLYRAEGGGAIDQDPAPLAEASPGDAVEVTVAAVFSAPTDVTVEIQRRTIPLGIDHYPRIVVDVEVGWTQAEEYVTTWQVMFFNSYCSLGSGSSYVASGVGMAETTRYRTIRIYEEPRFTGVRSEGCPDGPDFVYIAVVDDFGNLGPMSDHVRLNINEI